jgi:hypothetical protein
MALHSQGTYNWYFIKDYFGLNEAKTLQRIHEQLSFLEQQVTFIAERIDSIDDFTKNSIKYTQE